MLKRIRALIRNRRWAALFWAAVFAYSSMEEWRHMRQGMKEKDWLQIVGPTIAAIACGYMSSEAIEGNWP